MPRNCWTRCNKTFPCSFPAREKTREIESRETSRCLEKQAILALLRKMIYKSEFEEDNMTVDVYENCPIYENEYYMLRMTNKEDKADLLKVYSDEKSVPFFNSDNCGGDDFYYTTEKRMEQAIEFWHWEYDRQGFVRWTIVSKETNEAVGTIELFHREAEDYFTNCGLLRLDIRSDYEITSEIVKILELIIEPAYVLFQCDKIATKAIDLAVERISALKRLGFKYSEEKLIGHDGTEYDSYYVLEQ